jgi:hypothetical protein
MVSRNVNEIIKAAELLNEAEREQLRRWLDDRAAAGGAVGKRDRIAQLLLEQGIVTRSRLTPTPTDAATIEAWKPVPIQGKPLSETIIEERR